MVRGKLVPRFGTHPGDVELKNLSPSVVITHGHDGRQ